MIEKLRDFFGAYVPEAPPCENPESVEKLREAARHKRNTADALERSGESPEIQKMVERKRREELILEQIANELDMLED